MTEKIIVDEKTMLRTMQRLSHEIIEQNPGAETLYLVGIKRRGVPIAQRIGANIELFSDIRVATGELDITWYRDDLRKRYGDPKINEAHIGFDVTGKHIILVDDVLYTGRTARAAMEALIALGRPDRVQLLVMIDRGHRELPISANYAGKNIHFGVRELAMSAIANGITLHGGLRTFVGTFFVFSDYLKPMIRLAAIMGLPVTYVLTHDSIGVGEDGPTHEPIEQLAMLRSLPNINVFRPADDMETAAAWYSAITSTKTPTALVLTRQNLAPLAGSSKEALKGAYVVSDSSKETPDGIIIATGSEVALGIEAQEILKDEGVDVRVVSMPCMDIFEEQSQDYKDKILPKNVRARVAVEAGKDFGWGKYVGLDGATVCMTSFGASAPAAQLFEKFGFNKENVAEAMRKVIAGLK